MLFVYLVLIFTNLVLAYIPLSKQRDMVSLSFALSTLSISFWIFSNYMVQTSPAALTWARLTLIGSNTMAMSLLLFILHYPKDVFSPSRVRIVMIAAPSIVLALLSPTGFMIKGIENGTQIMGPGMTLFSVYFLVYIVAILFFTIRGILKYEGQNKAQLKIFALGLILSISLGSLTNLVFPLIGMSHLLSLGPLFASFLVFCMFYSLLKYSFLNIRVTVNRTLAWSMALILLATSYLSFTWMYKTYISKEISTLFLALSLALIFGLVGIFCPFRVLLQSTAEKLFLKGNFDYRSILIEFNRQLKGCSDLVTFCQIVQSVFREDLELASTRIFLSEDFNKIGVPSESLVEVSLQNKTLKKETVKIGKASPLMKLVNHHKKVLLKARAKSSEDVACFDEFDTEVIIPCLNQDNDLTCLILVGPKISQDAFKQEDLDLFNTLSNQLTIALDRAKKTRMAAEVTVAQSIQTQILPKDPELKGLELSCHMNPANEVGGDYYDVFHVNGKSWIVLGDVAGHGIGSGLVMFMVQSIIKTLLYENKDILPGELTYKANEILLQNMARLEDQRHMSILTMCTENGREFQVSGSHDSFYIFRSEIQEVEVIKVEQIPLGIGLTEMPREMFSDVHFSLAEKDVLFLGTDGITEAPLNGDIRQGIFEEERLIEFLEKNSDKPIDDMKKGLLQSLQTFTNGVFPDDLTFIIARANS